MNSKNQSASLFQHPVVVILGPLLCCLLWGSAFPCIKIGYRLFSIENTASQILFAGYRFLLAGILTFLLFSFLEKRVIRIKLSSLPYVIGQGLLQTTIQYAFFYPGLAHTTGSKGSIINASSSFFSIFAAHFLLKNEKMSVRKAIGCIIGFLGVIVVNIGSTPLGTGFALNGEGFVLVCSMAYGLSSVTMKLLSSRENTSVITAYQLMIGGAVLILIGWIGGGKVSGFTITSTCLLLYMAFLSAASFTIWAALLKYNPVGKIAIYGFSIPIFGVILSGIFLHESFFSFQTLAALLLVAGGIIIVNR